MMKKLLIYVIICIMVLGLIIGSNSDTLKKNLIHAAPEVSYAHFSVDDCNDIFKDLTYNEYSSIFDQPDLKFLKSLHDDYGIVVSLYVFYSWDVDQNDFDLSKATDRYQEEFAENSDWLKLGFHAADANAYQEMTPNEIVDYYDATIREIIRITGSADSIDRFVRLDRYTADADSILLMNQAEHGIQGLFIADQTTSTYRMSYALTKEESDQCYRDDWFVDRIGISYTPTDIRVESIDTDEMFYGILNDVHKENPLVIFTHEWAMKEENTKHYMKLLAEFIYEYGIPSAFCVG